MSFTNNQSFKALTANGGSKSANTKEGDFVGRIVGLVDINNPQFPKLKKKIQIQVNGETELFEDLINFNDEDQENYLKSLGFLQYHTKTAMISAGKPADFEQNVNEDWCEQQLNQLVSEKATVKFTQKMTTTNGKTSLKITFRQ